MVKHKHNWHLFDTSDCYTDRMNVKGFDNNIHNKVAFFVCDICGKMKTVLIYELGEW